MPTSDSPVVLTGDRTTGPLHLGQLATLCLQSSLPALAELAMFYLNFVTVARLERNPTVKDEIRSRGFERDMPAGFLCYPVAQAADITAFGAEVVPVGEDQVPMIEQCNEIVRRLNRQIGREQLRVARPLLSGTGRLPGLDGKGKISKSRGDAIVLSSSDERLGDAVDRMYTDPDHLRAADPGRVEGNVVFAYLDAFDPDREAVSDLKERYRRGGLGDIALKHRLKAVLRGVVGLIRERRAAVMRDRDALMDIVRQGTMKAEAVTDATKAELFEAFGLFRAPRPAGTPAGPRGRSEQAMGSLGRSATASTASTARSSGSWRSAARSSRAPRAEVEAPRRVEQVISGVRASALRAGLAPQVAEATYRAMISAFIEVEHAAFAARQRNLAEPRA